MTKITNTNTLAKIFGDAIIANSSLDKKHIINAKSLYGGTIQKSSNDANTVLESFKPDEMFITFLITHDDSNDTMTEDANDKLTTYDSFIATIIIYNDGCDVLAASLYARFLTQEILAYFHSNGIHIQTIDNKGDATDFLNGRLVRRRDLVVHFSCEIDTTKKEQYSDMIFSELHVKLFNESR